MANIEDQLLAGALNLAVNEAEQYKPEILAAIQAGAVTLEGAVDTFIDSVKLNGALALFAAPIKAAAKQAVAQLVSQVGSEEEAIFQLVVAAAQNEAKKLLA